MPGVGRQENARTLSGRHCDTSFRTPQSNYNSTHLQEIIDAGLPLPAVNQIPFHLFHSSVQAETIAFCVAHGVLVNGYR